MKKCKQCKGEGVVGVESGVVDPYWIISFPCKECDGTGVKDENKT
jgi:DnaJ-class molecular chaperone